MFKSKNMKTSHDKYQKLLEILHKETDIFKTFLEVLQTEQQYMKDLAFEKLTQCFNMKETLIVNLQVLEEARADIIKSISNDWTENITMSQLIEKSPSIYKDELKKYKTTLLNIINSIKEVHHVNSILAQRGLNYTQKSLNFIARLMYDLPIYHNSGDVSKELSKGMILCKEG